VECAPLSLSSTWHLSPSWQRNLASTSSFKQ